MGFGRLKFKTGSWLLNLDSKSKNENLHPDTALNGFNPEINQTTPTLVNSSQTPTRPRRKSSVSSSKSLFKMFSNNNNSKTNVYSPPNSQNNHITPTLSNHSLNTSPLVNQTDELNLLGLKLSEVQSERDDIRLELKENKERLNKIMLELELEKSKTKQKEDLRLELEMKYDKLNREEKNWLITKLTLETERDALMGQLEKIQGKMKYTTSNNDSINQKIQDLTSKVTELSELKASLTMERDQYKIWLTEEKESHDTTRRQLAVSSVECKNIISRLNEAESLVTELENVNKELNNQILSLSNNDTQKLEEDLDEAIKLAENYKLDYNKSQDQVLVLKETMDRLLSHENTPRSSHMSEILVSPQPPPEVMVTRLLPNRFNAGHERRKTLDLDQPDNSPMMRTFTSPSSQPASPQFREDTYQYWDSKLTELNAEKAAVLSSYAKIPTKLTSTVRRRKDGLEADLDRLDKDISTAKQKLRALHA